jgi:hypothetical protein
MEMMLKALALQHKMIGSDGMEGSRNEIGTPLTTPEEVMEQICRLPSIKEMAKRFKMWAIIYADRLKHMNNTPEMIKEMFKRVNPQKLPTRTLFAKILKECQEGAATEVKESREIMDAIKSIYTRSGDE